MKKIAILAVALSTLSAPSFAQTFDAGVTPQQQAVAQQTCAARGGSLAGASINSAGSLVVSCSGSNARVSTQGGAVLGLGGGLGAGAIIGSVLLLGVVASIVANDNTVSTP